MKTKYFYKQQGDVLLFKRDASQVDLTEFNKVSSAVLAEGEHTGHMHRLTRGSFDVLKSQSMMLVVVRETALLEHNEHGQLELEPGTYEIDRVREYDHFKEEARRVAD